MTRKLGAGAGKVRPLAAMLGQHAADPELRAENDREDEKCASSQKDRHPVSPRSFRSDHSAPSLVLDPDVGLLHDLAELRRLRHDKSLVVRRRHDAGRPAGSAPPAGPAGIAGAAMLCISAPASCCGLPTPEEENESLPRLARA